MYNIDLLKGQGLPSRDGVQKVAVIAIYSAMILILSVFVFCYNYHCNHVLQSKNEMIVQLESRLGNMAGVLEQIKDYKKRDIELRKSLVEVSDFLKYQNQWTGIMLFLNEKWPAGFMLDEIEVKVKNRSIRVPQRNDPDKKIAVNVPIRTLKINLHTLDNKESDQKIRGFQQQIRENQLFVSSIHDVIITRREPGDFYGSPVTFYEIDFVLYEE